MTRCRSSPRTIHNWSTYSKIWWETQLNIAEPKCLRYTSPPPGRVSTSGPFRCEITDWALRRSTLRGYLYFFNACTGVRNSRARGSGSRFAKRLWRDWAGEFGSSRNSAKAPRFILHCLRAIKRSDIDWSELRTDRSPVGRGWFERL